MENWGAVTYRESRLLIDPSRSTLSLTTRCTRTVCHELAHMWFGNYVTMEWWTQLWLNEGFARFMEFKAVEHIFPEWNIWQQFLYSVQGLAFDRDAMSTTHPVEQTVRHPKEIDAMFDVISYAKGASVLRMLHEWLGADTFMKGVRRYLEINAYGNAVTEDLWCALDDVVRLLDEKEKKKKSSEDNATNASTAEQKEERHSVKDMMKEWIQNPGFPVVSVSKVINPDDGSVRIGLSQARFATVNNTSTNITEDGSSILETKDTQDTQKSTPAPTVVDDASSLVDASQVEVEDDIVVWKIPLNFLSPYGSARHMLTMNHQWINHPKQGHEQRREQRQEQRKQEGDWLLVNAGRVGFFRVNYSQEMLMDIAPIIPSLNSADRLGLISDVIALSSAGLCDVFCLTKILLPMYKKEEELSVLQEIRDGLSSLLKIHANDADVTTYLRSLGLAIFQPKARALGWEPKENEISTDAVKRAVVLGMCVTCKDEATLQECTRRFNDIDPATFFNSSSSASSSSSSLAPELLGLVCIASVRSDEKKISTQTWNKLMTLHSVATLAAEKRTFQSAVGCAKDKDLMERTLEWAVHSGMVRNQDIFVAVASVGRTDAKRAKEEDSVMWSWYQKTYMTLVKRKLASSLMNSIFGSVLNGFIRDGKDKEEVLAWLNHQSDESEEGEGRKSMMKTFEKCMERVELTIARRDREGAVLRELAADAVAGSTKSI